MAEKIDKKEENNNKITNKLTHIKIKGNGLQLLSLVKEALRNSHN